MLFSLCKTLALEPIHLLLPGATIHTANGMMMRVSPRQQQGQQQQRQEPATATAAA